MTYKAGETAPFKGPIVCTVHPEVREAVEAGAKFPPSDHPEASRFCYWRYLD